MYNPLETLGTFVPCDAPRGIPVTHTPRKKVIPKKKKTQKKVVVHAVDRKSFAAELGVTPGNPKDLCGAIPPKSVALGTAKSASHAQTLAKAFGTGNLLLYFLSDASTDEPQYLAAGVTEGCVVDGVSVRGSWSVLSTFGGSVNPFSPAAVECSYLNLHDAVLCWNVLPAKPLNSVLAKSGFAKVLPFCETYRDIVEERRAGTSSRDIVAKDPMTRRLALLVEILFTFEERVRKVFLQFVSEHVQ